MIRKHSKNKTLWRRIFRACERAMIACVNRRDKACQLCGSKQILQVDHAIVSRRHLATFFEIRAQVLLCASCHLKKTFNQFGLNYKVTEVVRQREGSEYINWVITESRCIKKWSVQELEDLTNKFEEMYDHR